jgi:hypothetical protein
MAKSKITPAQRKALLWLAQHDGWQRVRDMDVATQTLHNLAFDRLIAVKFARVWGSGPRPLSEVRLNAAGRAAVESFCQHEWRQVELDGQECTRCGATRLAFGSGYESYLG